METLIVLGTGNALATRCYNTCFALRSGGEYILVDAGGGNGILVQLEKAGVDCAAIRHLIVTHEHCDHLLGVVWMVRKIGTMMLAGKYEGTLHLWCHAGFVPTIRTLCGLTLQKKFSSLLGGRIALHAVSDGETAQLLDARVTFFDIHSTKAPQYGFCAEWDGRKLTCLGDEPYNPLCEQYVRGSDWLLCEAFCLYGERERFKPYEKHHSTVREACELAQSLGVPHVVLWHTEDKNYDRRKQLYTAEGAAYYTGDLHVPYDLEQISL